MKKVLIAAVAVFTFGIATAQEKVGFSKEDVFISGAVNLQFAEQTGGSETSGFKISPKVGYFVSDHVAVGVGLSVGEDKAADKLKTQNFNANVFGRYYVSPASQFSLFGELKAGYTSVRQDTERQSLVKTGHTQTDAFNVAFAPGISYFISKHFALEASIGLFEYNTSKPANHVADQPRTDTFDFGLKLRDINLGLVYKF